MKYNNEMIHKIETSLQGEYIVKGDQLSTIKSMMEETHTTALSVAVIENSELRWSKGYGITDKVSKLPVNSNTVFQAASISKPITALAVMKLVEEGKLDLDVNVNSYLKSWKLPENEYTIKAPVTLRNLLSHTAGTSVSGFIGYNNTSHIPPLIDVLSGAGNANSAKIEVNMKPNTKYRYSGGGTTIVQQVLIDLLNQPFAEIMKTLVLKPLGMTHSFYKDSLLSDEEAKHIAAGHDSDGNQIPGKYHVYPEMAAAGLWTTVEDLAKYVIEVQKSLKNQSNKILSKDFIDLMVTPVLHGEYNLGLANINILNEHLLGHTGSNIGYKCSMLFHKEAGYGVVMMTNSDLGHKIKLPLLRSIAALNNWQSLLRPELEIQDMPKDITTLFCHKYKIDIDKSLNIFSAENSLYYQSFKQDKCELNYVGNNTLIDKHRKVLIKYDDHKKKFFMNDKKITVMNSNENLALDLIKLGSIKEAIHCYKEIIAKSPEVKLSLEKKLANLALDLGERGDRDTAIVILKVALELSPQSAICWDILGDFYFETNQFELAIQAMQKSLKYDPKNNNAKKIIEDAKQKIAN